MNASHASLSIDFEVSCAELDFLADKAQKMDFVLGSRMMGGGFGGCTLNLVKSDFLEEFKKQMKSGYQLEFDLEPEFIEVALSDGATIIANQSNS